MPIDKSKLPSPDQYFLGQFKGAKISGKSLRLPCPIHKGNGPNLSVDRESGLWQCFTCNARGGDVVDFEMQWHKVGFVRAASNFGAWIPNGQAPTTTAPRLDYRAMLNLLQTEVQIAALIASDISNGKTPSAQDASRLITSAGRINQVVGVMR